jgi:hypothetical protein
LWATKIRILEIFSSCLHWKEFCFKNTKYYDIANL